MTPEELRERSMTFAVEVFKYARPLFASAETRGVGGQLVDSATSIAANYRAAVHARSPKEWRAKLGLVLEESDETVFWLQFIGRALPHMRCRRQTRSTHRRGAATHQDFWRHAQDGQTKCPGEDCRDSRGVGLLRAKVFLAARLSSALTT